MAFLVAVAEESLGATSWKDRESKIPEDGSKGNFDKMPGAAD